MMTCDEQQQSSTHSCRYQTCRGGLGRVIDGASSLSLSLSLSQSLSQSLSLLFLWRVASLRPPPSLALTDQPPIATTRPSFVSPPSDELSHPTPSPDPFSLLPSALSKYPDIPTESIRPSTHRSFHLLSHPSSLSLSPCLPLSLPLSLSSSLPPISYVMALIGRITH